MEQIGRLATAATLLHFAVCIDSCFAVLMLHIGGGQGGVGRIIAAANVFVERSSDIGNVTKCLNYINMDNTRYSKSTHRINVSCRIPKKQKHSCQQQFTTALSSHCIPGQPTVSTCHLLTHSIDQQARVPYACPHHSHSSHVQSAATPHQL
jgi:hypothetical protein